MNFWAGHFIGIVDDETLAFHDAELLFFWRRHRNEGLLFGIAVIAFGQEPEPRGPPNGVWQAKSGGGGKKPL
jgi:hypothetical protein